MLSKPQYNRFNRIASERGPGLSEHVLLIGACGWQHPVWREEFYPDGLPDDWQLGFYGNEYRVVLIPADYWQRPDIDVGQWLEETDASPRFLSEWPLDADAQQRARSGMAQLGARAIGFVIRLAKRPDDTEITIYKELRKDHNIVFDLQPLSPAQQTEVELLLNNALGRDRFGLCWHGKPETATNLQSGPVAVTRIDKVRDARELRRIIEANLAACNDTRLVVLIIDGNPPNIQLMQNAGIILDLL